MSGDRSQDLLDTPALRQHTESKLNPWELAVGSSLERRLSHALVRLRHDDEALVAMLRDLPPVQRMTARVVLVRELGGARTTAMYLRAFGPDPALSWVPGEEAGDAAQGSLGRYKVALTQGRQDILGALGRLGMPPTAQERAPLLQIPLMRLAERRAAMIYRREAGPAQEAEPEHPAVQEAVQRAGSGDPLADDLRKEMEARFGVSFARVRVHTDRVAAEAAQAVHAQAFTVGEDIFFAAGAFSPQGAEGRELLTHELVHVVQGYEGRVPRTGEVRVSEPGEELEREATAAGRRAAEAGGLPVAVGAKMEAAFGADFSGVRIHQGPEAAALGARAYTQGTDIHFAPGEYSPDSAVGQELIGHELTHVVQQAEGKVSATISVMGVALNDDPQLEREADEQGARAARGQPARSGLQAAAQTAGPAQTKPMSTVGGADPATDQGVVPEPGAETLTDPAAAAAGQAKASSPSALIQAHGLGPIQRQPKTYVPYLINATEDMSGEQYKVAAMIQVFGKVLPNLEWKNIKASYTADQSPYTLYVEVSLLKRVRGAVNQEKGIDTDKDGRVASADARAKKFDATPALDAKQAVIDEIDRRYYKAAGVPAGTKVKAGEKGRSVLWFSIRDEVLFQQEYLGNLPPKVKQLVKESIKGRELTPADYDKLFAIAKKIEKMPAGQVADYASKITGSTTDLDVFDAALDRYQTDMAARDKRAEEQDKVKTKLVGLEGLYTKYREYKQMLTVEAIGASIPIAAPGAPVVVPIGPTASSMIRKELDAQLQANNFASLAEFEDFIKKYLKGFEAGAVDIANDLLAKYAGTLHKEAERYQDPGEISSLYQALGGTRTQHAEFEKNATIANDYKRDSELARLPGNGHLQPKIGPEEAKAAYDKAVAAKSASQAEVQRLASTYPILKEEGLPLDKRIDKTALARASESELGGLLAAHIAIRQKDVGDARDQIDGKHELIYKMGKLMPAFYAQQGVQPGSIYDMIIQDKLKEDAIIKLFTGIVLAVVAIALAVVSFGTATPAIVAAGASMAGFGLSAYMAYDEYKSYTAEKDLAAVGFADDPSMVWLVIAVAGAALDMASAVKSVQALGKAGKVFAEGGDLVKFKEAVKALEKEGQIEANVARAVEKAAAARKGLAQATDELGKVLMGRTYSFPGPFVDPDVYRALVTMAKEGLVSKYHDVVQFIEELKLARVRAGLAEMTPQELNKAKEAWAQAKALQKSASEPIEIIGESGRTIGKYSNGSHLEIIPSKAKDKLYGGNTIKLDPDATTTVTGTLNDTNKIAVRGEQLPGVTQMGANQGGINILRSPKWAEIQSKYKSILESGDELKYWKTVTDEFWETANKPWLDEAIARGDKFRFVSDPTAEGAIYVTKKTGEFILDGGNKVKSIFGREVDYLISKGYEFTSDGTAVLKGH